MDIQLTNTVEANQFRVGPESMIQVLGPKNVIRSETINYSSTEGIIIFATTTIFKQKEKGKVDLVFCDSAFDWEYHTVESIKEKWPIVLSGNWLNQLMGK